MEYYIRKFIYQILKQYNKMENYLFSIILDADASSVVQRVALRTDDIPLGEQTVAQVIFLCKLLFFINN